MNRPIYENDETRRAEQEVIESVSRAWRCEAVKLATKYHIDYALYRNKLIRAWAEVKCRTITSTSIPDYMVALDKVMHLMDFAKISRCPAFLIVRFIDRIMYCDITAVDIEIRDGGRTVKTRGDWQDSEPCVYIPMRYFKVFTLGG